MWRFVIVTFGFLGWGFYEMSGGADYRPAPNSIQARADRQGAPRPRDGARPVPETGDVVLASAGANIGVPTVAVVPRAAPREDRQEDRRFVRAREADLRIGPGEGYGRVALLERDTEVVVLRDPGGGWVKLRVIGGGDVGWAVARLFGRVR